MLSWRMKNCCNPLRRVPTRCPQKRNGDRLASSGPEQATVNDAARRNGRVRLTSPNGTSLARNATPVDYSHPGRGGRVAEGGGLLNRYKALKPYRGFESPPLRSPR